MTQLSDTQAMILSAAAQRPERIALPLPESLRGGAAAKVVGAMIAKGLLQEVDADMRKGEPVWRETGDGHGTTLVATDAGLAAIGIEPDDAEHCAPGRDRSADRGGCDGRPIATRGRAQGAHAARGHQAGHADRHAARAGGRDHRGDHGRHRLAVAHGARRDGRGAEEEARLEVSSEKIEGRGRVYRL
jgi:hypothetical protein